MSILCQQLLAIADAFCVATGASRVGISGRIFSDGKRLDAVAAGADLNTRSWEKAMAWFAANWPEGVAWPDNVERPGAFTQPARGEGMRGGSVQESSRPAEPGPGERPALKRRADSPVAREQ